MALGSTRSPTDSSPLQALDGIGAGICGVAIVAMGGVIGSGTTGLLVQPPGFAVAFRAFGGLAGLAAAAFLVVPETRPTPANTVAKQPAVC